MLSNPTNSLQNRQRQHRRQNSTPTAFEPVKVSSLPNIQRHGGHRRGMSLDQRRRQSPPQELMVSHINLGQQTTQQHILRETQQQRLARPGQQFRQLDNDENYLQSPIVTPHRQSFDASCISQYGTCGIQSQNTYTGPVNSGLDVSPNSFTGHHDFNLYSVDAMLNPSAFLDFNAGYCNDTGASIGSHTKKSSLGRRISGGIVDRVAQFENLALQSPHRPITPPSQNVTDYFPLTPIDTPHGRHLSKQEPLDARFVDDFDTSMEDTIRPKANQRARGTFDDMRKEAENNLGPSPPNSGTLAAFSTFDSAPVPSDAFINLPNSDVRMGLMKDEEQFSEPQFSTTSKKLSPSSSFHPSPHSDQLVNFDSQFSNNSSSGRVETIYPDPESLGFTTHEASVQSQTDRDSIHRRSESVSSINIEESITETGITIDDIARFINGPDPSDGRWLCVFPDCNKRFGRKENIKSHVQTHLGDRQFQCSHCKKCFVRQHDLKRHAKIHSGVKPYPCQCGNSFARHDALTRHRQRGMCIGAFEGVVKKTVKRGRPRKNRPDNEERIKKSSRTRTKNKAMSSASSTTSCSESGDECSPRSELDVFDDQHFTDFGYGQSSDFMNHAGMQHLQPHSPAADDCVSPQAMQAQSPSTISNHSHLSHRGSISDGVRLPSHPASPAKSIHSTHSYHSPPGLCESSSSPAPSNQYYDFQLVSHQDSGLDINGLSNISQHDEEMFLEAFAAASNGHSGLTALEREPYLLADKFEESFGHTGSDDLFRNEEDVFFGSP